MLPANSPVYQALMKISEKRGKQEAMLAALEDKKLSCRSADDRESVAAVRNDVDAVQDDVAQPEDHFANAH